MDFWFPLVWFGIPLGVAVFVSYKYKVHFFHILLLSALPALLLSIFHILANGTGGENGNGFFIEILQGFFLFYLMAFALLMLSSAFVLSIKKTKELGLKSYIAIAAVTGFIVMLMFELMAGVVDKGIIVSIISAVLGAMSAAIMYYFTDYRKRETKGGS